MRSLKVAAQVLAFAGLVAGLAGFAGADDLRSSLKPGAPDLKSAGALAFGPDGVLFVSDPQAAALFAIDTGDKADKQAPGQVAIEDINGKVASALGTGAEQVLINDLAVNPASGNIYLSVSRGRGPDALPVLLRVDRAGSLSEVSLKNVPFAKATLPNAPADAGQGRQNQRLESITDLAYLDGRVIVAGLSNEEFASKLRSIPFPFKEADAGTSVEIYHGAHGKFETRSPVRTFVPFEIKGESYLLAAYTCTPLVKFPVKELRTGTKVKGTTVAELGNGNRPLDMISYQKDGRSYILMANNKRGMMKITTEGIDSIAAIEKKIDKTAGLAYETIAGLEGVVQLDRLDDKSAVVILAQKDGRMDLKSIALP